MDISESRPPCVVPESGLLARRRTSSVAVGDVKVGSEHPVVVQSMTNTDTADVEATVRQVAELAEAGSELVRITVNTSAAAAAVPTIVGRLDTVGVKRLRVQICDHTKDSLIVQLNAQRKAGLSVVLEDFGRTAPTRGFDPRRTHISFFDQIPRDAG